MSAAPSSSSSSSSTPSSTPSSSRPPSTQASSPSTPGSSSGSRSASPPISNPVNSLLPPVLPPTTQTFAAELDPYAEHRAIYAQQNPPSAIPEKCLTFCSQRADAPPLCRMFCLRKRQAVKSQREEIARLRPPKIREANSHATGAAGGIGAVTAVDTLLIPPPGSAVQSSSSSGWGAGASGSRTNADSQRSWFAGLGTWSPFDALKRTLDPYSFVYVRGTPDGVVGRYMEEMEYDDGAYDFGVVSRGAGKALARRREENQWEWLDWGDHGALFYLPLTSVFYPIIAIPQTLKTVFAPSIELLSRYKDSFTDGTQRLNYKAFKEEMADGGAVKMIEKFDKYLAERTKELKALREKEKEERESKMSKMTKVGDENKE